MTAPRIRLLMAGLLLVTVIVAALALPIPSALQMRAWVQSVGTTGPMLFLLGQTLVTVAPIPRTVFT
ncbi:MAG: TVP38/TMEM64 family protein, partial [Pseudonocardiaceae bacterium]